MLYRLQIFWECPPQELMFIPHRYMLCLAGLMTDTNITSITIEMARIARIVEIRLLE